MVTFKEKELRKTKIAINWGEENQLLKNIWICYLENPREWTSHAVGNKLNIGNSIPNLAKLTKNSHIQMIDGIDFVHGRSTISKYFNYIKNQLIVVG